MLLNLCVNARDAMPSGGILTLAVENFPINESFARVHIDAKTGPYVLIKISDTGTGIPPDVIDKIFEPFFTTKEVSKGTGLGLSTSLSLVKGHGGFVDVYSEINEGTTFKIYLPALLNAVSTKVERERTEFPTGHGELILVVDDEAAILEMTKQTLEMYNYTVATAKDGAEAVAIYVLRKKEIQLVLTDMSMPFMDGRATIRALRRINPQVKIVAASGLGATKSGQEADLRVQAFLPKPYTADKLLTTVHQVLHDGEA